jgi:hypothetical protein
VDPTSSSEHHDSGSKIPTIKKLFRTGKHHSDSSSEILNSIPVIPKLDFNATNSTTTATVTIPVYDGLRGGPCIDKTTGQIIP